jgi:hypothetical protein
MTEAWAQSPAFRSASMKSSYSVRATFFFEEFLTAAEKGELQLHLNPQTAGGIGKAADCNAPEPTKGGA